MKHQQLSLHFIAGKGSDQLSFGMSPDAVRSEVGEPSQIRQFDSWSLPGTSGRSPLILVPSRQQWYYDSANVGLTFFEEHPAVWKLVTITSFNQGTTVNGAAIVGIEVGKAEELLAQAGVPFVAPGPSDDGCGFVRFANGLLLWMDCDIVDFVELWLPSQD